MKSRILFFDDEPQTCRRFREALESRGHVVVTPKTLAEAIHEIEEGGSELLVHGAHHTETYWNLCDEIFAKYPQFPSIHFATGPTSTDYIAKFKGPFHQKLRPLIPEKNFLKVVNRALFTGRLNRENETLQRSLNLHRQLQQVFETLDAYELQRRVVDFFAQEFKAKNVFYLSAGEFHFYKEELWKIVDMHSAEEEQHHLVAAHPTEREELTKLFDKLTAHMPAGWEEKTTMTRVVLPGQHACVFVPLVGLENKKIMGHILLTDPEAHGSSTFEKVVTDVSQVIGRHLEQIKRYANAKSMNYMDDLTDLYNQRYLKLVLDKEISRCERTEQPFSVLFMDIDHFKQVNDTRGHLIGSKVLVELAKILHTNIRSMDYGFRYGGDEFILILINTDVTAATVVAERIRKQVEAATFKVNNNNIQVTLSIGVASYPKHAVTKEQIISLADEAMYCGKNKSRNIVYVAS